MNVHVFFRHNNNGCSANVLLCELSESLELKIIANVTCGAQSYY